MVNGKGYVGSSMNLKERKYTHFSALKSHRHHNPHLQSSFNKYGASNFMYYILAYVPEDKLLERETFYINYLKVNQRKNGYNLAFPDRHIILEEQKRKTSETLKKKYLLCPKPPISSEQKRKISEALKGRKLSPLSEEHKNKIAEGVEKRLQIHPRSSMSQEHKRKISEALTGRKLPPFSEEHKKRISESLLKRNLQLSNS
jgi:group I intron endonuclease